MILDLTPNMVEDLDTFAFVETLTREANAARDAVSETSPLGSYDGLLAYLLQPGELPIPQGLLVQIKINGVRLD